jgi:hypothetical protein
MKAQSQRGGWTENAALVYYQAFLLYEKPEATLGQMLHDFQDGRIGPNETIRAHVEKNRRVIEYAVKLRLLPGNRPGAGESSPHQAPRLATLDRSPVARRAVRLSRRAGSLRDHA